MKHYFLIAKEVGDLTRILCASLEAKEMKSAPTLARVFSRFAPRRNVDVAGHAGFRIEGGRLGISDDSGLCARSGQPAAAFRHRRIARMSKSIPMRSSWCARSLPLIDKALCANPEANRSFLDLLTESRDPETILRLMNEAGVLGRFIPEFGRIVALMQFNMYHHYTVDEHLIRTVGMSRRDRARRAWPDEHPLSTKIFPTLTSRRALYVAVLPA